MRRTLPLLLAAAAATAVPTSASARGFSYGVAAGEVTAKSALLWARADKGGPYTLQVSTDRRFRSFVDERVVKATKSRDNTLQRTIKGLKPDTTYYYRFANGSKRSAVGKLRTAPNSNKAKTIKFAYSGDADAQPGLGSTKPFYNNFQAYRSMARAGNLFNINLGDTIYSDSEVPGRGALVTTVKQKWAKYKQNLALKNLQLFRGATGTYSHWDDHEFADDFTKAERGLAIYKAGVRAFRDYMPVTYSSSRGIYRTFRWGKSLELFFLDERSFRSAKASANHACDNPQTGGPDLAPTGPQANRTLFAVFVPSLAAPVSQQCLNTINDPKRTMLGSKQLAAFEKAVKSSNATWKLIVNEVPIQQYYTLPYDRWEGYAAERTKLLKFLAANVKNVAFLSTDVHANLVNDARFQTLEPGGPKDSGIMDFATGPVATMTYVKEIDRTTGRAGNGKLVTDAFFKPSPPNGVGMKCAQTDVFSYAEVTVNSKQLRVAYRDQNGNALPECGPFTVKTK